MKSINNESSLSSISLPPQTQGLGSGGPIAVTRVANSPDSPQKFLPTYVNSQEGKLKEIINNEDPLQRNKRHFLDPQKTQLILADDHNTLTSLKNIDIKTKYYTPSCCQGDYIDTSDDEESESNLRKLSISIKHKEHDEDLRKIIILLLNVIGKTVLNFDKDDNITSPIKFTDDNDSPTLTYDNLCPKITFVNSLLSLKNFTFILKSAETVFLDFLEKKEDTLSLANENKIFLLPLLIKKLINHHDEIIPRDYRFRHTDIDHIKERFESMLAIGTQVKCVLENQV